jgi:hypothetical protein
MPSHVADATTGSETHRRPTEADEGEEYDVELLEPEEDAAVHSEGFLTARARRDKLDLVAPAAKGLGDHSQARPTPLTLMRT